MENYWLYYFFRITDSEAYIQYAILYTNPYGQRIIRVINLSLQVTNNMSIKWKQINQ